MLGDPETQELFALKRISFTGSSTAKLQFPAVNGAGRRIVGVQLSFISDAYVGLDQQHWVSLPGAPPQSRPHQLQNDSSSMESSHFSHPNSAGSSAQQASSRQNQTHQSRTDCDDQHQEASTIHGESKRQPANAARTAGQANARPGGSAGNASQNAAAARDFPALGAAAGSDQSTSTPKQPRQQQSRPRAAEPRSGPSTDVQSNAGLPRPPSSAAASGSRPPCEGPSSASNRNGSSNAAGPSAERHGKRGAGSQQNGLPDAPQPASHRNNGSRPESQQQQQQQRPRPHNQQQRSRHQQSSQPRSQQQQQQPQHSSPPNNYPPHSNEPQVRQDL